MMETKKKTSDYFLEHLTQNALEGISDEAINGKVSTERIEYIAQRLLPEGTGCVLLTGSYAKQSARFLSDIDLYVISENLDNQETPLRRELRILDGAHCEVNISCQAYLQKFIGASKRIRSGRTTPALAASKLLVGDEAVYRVVKNYAIDAYDPTKNSEAILKIKESYRYALTASLMDLKSADCNHSKSCLATQLNITLNGLASINSLGWVHGYSYLAKSGAVQPTLRKELINIQQLYEDACLRKDFGDFFDFSFNYLLDLGGAKWKSYADGTILM